MGTTFQSPEGIQKAWEVEVDEVDEKMLFVTVVNRKPHVGTRADSENLPHDLEGIVYMFKNMPAPAR